MNLFSVKNFFLVVILFLTSKNVLAQSYFGFRAEPFIFVSQTHNLNFVGHSPKSDLGIYLSSFLFTYKYEVSNKISLSSRAGYLWTNEDRYNGFEAGQFMQYYLTDKNYILAGALVHFNKEDFIREFHLKNVVIPFLTFGLGMKFSRLFSTELQFNLPLVIEYRTSASTFSSNSYRLWGIVKLSFGLEWEL